MVGKYSCRGFYCHCYGCIWITILLGTVVVGMWHIIFHFVSICTIAPLETNTMQTKYNLAQMPRLQKTWEGLLQSYNKRVVDTLTVYTEKVHDCMFISGVGLISLNVVHMKCQSVLYCLQRCICMLLQHSGSIKRGTITAVI